MVANELYREWRAAFEAKFATTQIVAGSAESHVSPSGLFTLEVTDYGQQANRWSYSRGIIRRVSDGAVIADIKRNHGNFWHAWVECHDRGAHVLCGEDYQGYSVIDLISGQIATHFPEEAFQGLGFCWAAVHPSPDGLTLAVDGCYWACPYELRLLDFREPMTLPLREIARIEDFDDFIGWLSPTEITYRTSESGEQMERNWRLPDA